MNTMAGYAANPNIYGTIIISLGCKNCQLDLVASAIRKRTNKPLKGLIIQEEGGTSILSETTEFIGAEHILARRAKNQEVHDQILHIVHRYEETLRQVGKEVRDANPSPGNKAGGITTLEEKSLSCIHKGATA